MSAMIAIGTRTIHRVPITGQSHARLRHEIPKVLSDEDIDSLAAQAAGEEQTLASQLAGFTGKAYRLLVILAPALGDAMTEHEWQGFPTEEALRADDYDGTVDNAPSIDQIVDAFDKALEVNGLKKLGDLISLARDGQALFGGTNRPPASGRPTTPTSLDSPTSTTG